VASYVNSRRWVKKSSVNGDGNIAGEIIDFHMDSAADLAKLPLADEVKETSSALDISTGDVYVLATAGWVKMP